MDRKIKQNVKKGANKMARNLFEAKLANRAHEVMERVGELQLRRRSESSRSPH